VSYGWPVKPFDRQHAVRGYFCDPRIAGRSRSFHFGIDVAAPDGTAVYAVAPGTVELEGPQNIAVIEPGEPRAFGYWHVRPGVRAGQRVRRHQLLGHIARGWGHVHFAERRDGRYWNPLRAGALTPFADFGAPVVDRIVAERRGVLLDAGALTGVVSLVAEAHDNPPISAPPPWQGLPVTPALVRWRLVRRGREVVPWRVIADFRTTLPPKSRYGAVYARGTRQNHPNQPGRYRFKLAAAWDTREHPDGRYRLDVEAADIRANASRDHLLLVVVNESV
jgi:murein DD-endopeptidase MepM/ murein hydrolase activator NlpD